MTEPYRDKPCPRDTKMACKDCTWYLRDGMRCKLGYTRVTEPPIVKPLGKDREYTTKW